MPYVCYLGDFYLFKFFLNLEPQSCWTTASFFNSLTRHFNGKGVAWIVKLGPTRYSFFVCLFVRSFVCFEKNGFRHHNRLCDILHFSSVSCLETARTVKFAEWYRLGRYKSLRKSSSFTQSSLQRVPNSNSITSCFLHSCLWLFLQYHNLLLQGSQKKKDAIGGNRQKLSSQKHGRGVRREFN